MGALIAQTVSAGALAAPADCLAGCPGPSLLQGGADVAAAAACLGLGAALGHSWWRRRAINQAWLLALTGLCLAVLGAAYLLAVVTPWGSPPALRAVVELLAASLLVVTAGAVWFVLPRRSALLGADRWRAANEDLERELARGRSTEATLREAQRLLEARIGELAPALALADAGLEREAGARRQAECRAADSSRTLQHLLATSPFAVIEADAIETDWGTWRVRRWSDRAEAIFGWPAAAAVGRTLRDLGLLSEVGEDRCAGPDPALANGSRSAQAVEVRCRTRQGGIRACRWHISSNQAAPEAARSIMILIEDITDRVAAAAQIHNLAHHDQLTGLPNRTLLDQRLGRALAGIGRSGGRVALVLLDLDHSKDVNDAFGHTVGDAVLSELARRMQALVADADTLACLGSDKFALVLTGEVDRRSTEGVIARILRAASSSLQLSGRKIVVNASIGATLAPEDGLTPERLFRNADLALHRAKAAGRGSWRFYAATMDSELRASRSLQDGLRHALDQNGFGLLFQPIFALDEDRPIQVEALLRWPREQGGSIPPAVFIPVAETAGLIPSIGEWVLGQACGQAAQWQGEGLDLKVGVNVSAIQLRQPDFLATVMRCLRRAGLAPDRLELEVTESVFVDPSKDLIVGVLRRLAEVGITLAIDDFGTGYSSLAYLKYFPFHKIKIDGSFVRDVGRGSEGAAIVSAVVALGQSLGKLVVAEGVEEEDQLTFLRQRGCDLAQGYLLGRPASGADILERWRPVDKRRFGGRASAG